MSVVKSKRRQGTLKVLLDVVELCKYTNQITCNQKHFPKRHRRTTQLYIVIPCRDVAFALQNANSIKVETHQDYLRRKSFQDKALEHLNCLLVGINLAYHQFSLNDRKVGYWSQLCYNLRQQIKKWRDSDARRERLRLDASITGVQL